MLFPQARASTASQVTRRQVRNHTTNGKGVWGNAQPGGPAPGGNRWPRAQNSDSDPRERRRPRATPATDAPVDDHCRQARCPTWSCHVLQGLISAGRLVHIQRRMARGHGRTVLSQRPRVQRHVLPPGVLPHQSAKHMRNPFPKTSPGHEIVCRHAPRCADTVVKCQPSSPPAATSKSQPSRLPSPRCPLAAAAGGISLQISVGIDVEPISNILIASLRLSCLTLSTLG